MSPSEFGAGIANITIVNFAEVAARSRSPVPTPRTSPELAPGASDVLKMKTETGDYEAIAEGDGDFEPFPFVVGPERESASNELLLP